MVRLGGDLGVAWSAFRGLLKPLLGRGGLRERERERERERVDGELGVGQVERVQGMGTVSFIGACGMSCFGVGFISAKRWTLCVQGAVIGL